MRKCTIRVAKTKTLISFAVIAKLICVFVFTYADCWFSHKAALILEIPTFYNACGAWWHSVRASDSKYRVPGFDPH